MSDPLTNSGPACRALVLTDFNGGNFAGYLRQDAGAPRLEVDVATFAGAATPAERSSRTYDVAVVWVRPQAVSAAFSTLVDSGEADLPRILADVDAFAADLERLRASCARIVVASWQAPRVGAMFSALAMTSGGLSNVVMQMNLRLAGHAARIAGVTCLDSAAWMPAAEDAFDSRLWYAAKVPFKDEVFKRATEDVKSFLRASLGESRKLVVVDLDDTLWGGLVGEVGWESLRLGGHDPIGEAHVDFQRTLAMLARRGVLLAIASKNDEAVALGAIEQHPEMVLRRRDFAAWRINWHDKAQNIVDLTRELNLGLSSVVFIDDSRTERERVRAALPEVLVPEWPATPLLYVERLLELRCFNQLSLTAEDRQRAQMYAAEAARLADRQMSESTEDWLRRLGVRVEVEEFGSRNATRAVQLLNKTNQMNLSTRRLAAAELETWLREGRRQLWTFRVSDSFGDAGLTGLASVSVDGSAATLVDFVLSCRVFSRGIEQAMLHHVTQSAAELGASELVVDFKATAKNSPCLEFLQSSGLEPVSDRRFRWSLQQSYPLPPAIELLQARSETLA